MGWGSGSELMGNIIPLVEKYVPDKSSRVSFYKELINTFEHHDWDTQCDCMGISETFDLVLKETHPEWDWSYWNI